MSRLNLEDSIIHNPRFTGKLLDAGLVKVPDATTYTVKAIDSGRIHVLPNLTADIAISLPAAAVGLNYEFIYGGAAADAQDWAIAAGTGNAVYFVGGVVFIDLDTDVVAPVYSDGNSNELFTVLTPEVGTSIKLVCDGAVWYINGQVCSATVPTFAD